MESNQMYRAEMKVYRSRKSCRTAAQRESHKRFKALYLNRVEEHEQEMVHKYLIDFLWCAVAAIGIILITGGLFLLGLYNADAIDYFTDSVLKLIFSR